MITSLAHFDVGISPSIKAKKLSQSLYKVNWVAFNQDLHQNLAAFTIGDDLDSAVATWYHLLMKVLDKHAPLTMKRKKAHRRCPWLTAELVQLVRQRNALHKRLLERGKATISKLSKAGVRAVFGLHNPVSTQPLLNELHVSEITDIMFRKVLVFV